eukprot:8754137-Karenia_brevis.AAC.1
MHLIGGPKFTSLKVTNLAARLRFWRDSSALVFDLVSSLSRCAEMVVLAKFGLGDLSPQCWGWSPLVTQLQEHAQLHWVG